MGKLEAALDADAFANDAVVKWVFIFSLNTTYNWYFK